LETIILAGGLGTRLRHLLPNTPKVMAPVNGKPFLFYVLSFLKNSGVNRVVLSVGYLSEQISEHFGDSFEGMVLEYSREEAPLLTGGAIKKSLELCREESVFVFNGDTFLGVDMQKMMGAFTREGYQSMIAVRKMTNFDRYGTVTLEGNRIINFKEKEFQNVGLINAGVYLIKREFLKKAPEVFSYEKFLTENINSISIGAWETDGYFIDIGIEEDYNRIQIEYKSMENKNE